ncbi:MAG: rRNA maturation RNase YbeY [Enterobacteriaceae bacterium PSpicST2]|nr:MAG: rRNA maturation RNase YbeY [Enterobacteriaceae bacterium PSpicST2]WMC19006.1 MAG: rRNA maturation RNase YbeY [Enterobacteriaceae bacterium PSpicST1]
MKLLLLNFEKKKKNKYFINKREIIYLIKNITKKFKKKIKIIIKLVNKKKIKRINFIYKGIYKYTNILSFKFINNKKKYLGDLIIYNKLFNFNKIIKNVKKKIYIYIIVHGILHLLNFNHIKNFEKKQMEILEIELLKNLKYNNPYYF